jgi:hypothetical protein
MSPRGKQSGEFVMARPAGFVEGGKSLVDDQEMHFGR